MIEVNNLADGYKRIDEDFLKKTAKKFLAKEKIKAKQELSIALVNPEEIKKLNRVYRGKNSPTDVLSFGMISDFVRRSRGKKGIEKDFLFPEIVICPAVIEKNADKSKEPFKKELARALVHALLHLLGYDHERGAAEAKKMLKKQEDFLSAF
ncbi:MAG: rRNA maturation RNase YbeY [Candidatus Paceibacterota bacterium]